ncbi:MAG: DUF819 domain-containing protein [Candidatus Aminicenantes bacterium]|nr:DUF819 domain-containing protein [Candidatus Aminicenantes bacterium]
MESLIHPNDAWTIWTIILCSVALSIYLEQHYKWASKLTGPVIAIIIAIVLSNTKVLPIQSPSYTVIESYLVPLAIPLLLFRANIFKIIKTSGATFGAFHLSVLGTVIGCITAAFIFNAFLPFAAETSGVMTGSYSGGAVNFVALSATFMPSDAAGAARFSEQLNALMVADNVIMATMFFVLMSLTGIGFFRKKYPMPHQKAVEEADGSDTLQAASFWKRKDISLLDMAKALALAVFIAAIAQKISGAIKTLSMPNMLKDILGNPFLLMTTFCMIAATAFHKRLENIHGAEELGTYLIYFFFFLIGVPADLMRLILKAPLLFLYCVVIAVICFVTTFGLGRLFKMNLEDLGLSVNAALGGPVSAAAMAIAKGWKELVLPALLVGIWGYVIGTYLGVVVGNLLKTIL